MLLLVSGVFASCDLFEKKTEEVLSVSIAKSQVAYNKGQQFVNVQCSGDWTLALVSDGDIEWATLDVTSGTGDKANVRFTYQENATGHSRDLRIVLDNGSKWTECTFTQSPKEESVTPTPTPEPEPTGKLYRVQVGAYQKKESQRAAKQAISGSADVLAGLWRQGKHRCGKEYTGKQSGGDDTRAYAHI